MIYLVASANEAYAHRIAGWLDAVSVYGAGVQPVLACVIGGDSEPWVGRLASEFPAVWFRAISRAALPYVPPLDHLQAGGFLDYLACRETDTIIFTDGDAILQRPLTPDELGWLADWPEAVLGLSYNAGPDDTLATEGARLRPQGDATERGFDVGLPVYNLGVIVSRPATYRRWFAAYQDVRPRLEGLFDHHAHQQWGLCACAPDAGSVRVLPPTFHLHGHYPPPDGVAVGRKKGRVTANGAVIAFRHHL